MEVSYVPWNYQFLKEGSTEDDDSYKVCRSPWMAANKNASFLSQPALSSRFASTGDVCPTVSVSVPHSGGNVSSVTGSDTPEDIVPICSIADANGLVHLMVKLPLKKDSSSRR